VARAPDTLVDLLRETQTRHGDRCAFKYRDQQVVYWQLWQSISQCANALRARGIRRGDRVALLLDNSPEYAIAYYGILKCGAIAIGLNTALRSPDLIRTLQHCEASMLVASASHAELAPIAASDAVRAILQVGKRESPLQASAAVADWDECIRESDATDFRLDAQSSEAAAIIYTSGTTGAPKGVTLSHSNLVANTNGIVQYLTLTEADSIVNVLPFFYSYGNSVLHTHLSVGGCLVLENSLAYPHLVVEKLAIEAASGFAGVPSTFALLLQRVKLEGYDLSKLRYVTQAGGAMRPELMRRWREALPASKLFVMYGQTEATARLTYLPPERLEDKLGSVGIAIPGVEIRVRSEEGFEVGPNVGGEIWVRGANTMLGYWRDAAGTAAVLQNGWLKTGDMGYLDVDGFLWLNGRRSDMIKAGAHRIHPQEIEETIAQLAGVAEVAVIGVDDEILGQAIKAVIVAASGTELSAMQVQAHCKRHLPTYKIPKTVVMTAALPKTASGKVRRAELE
jgi:acyl-CoA synthetase (AMP-forming)/AMP-acid ligase II